MKGIFKSLGFAAVMAIASTSLVMAQMRMNPSPQQPNSIHPGEVNYIEGQVALNGANLESQSLRSTVIQPGDDLTTGQGYAEILLTPGAFLRVGHESEVRMQSVGLVDSRITLVRGSALLEAADVVKGSSLNVVLGNGTAQIKNKGLYSFNAAAQTIKVFDGDLKLTDGGASNTTLRKGDQVILTSDHPLKKHDFKIKPAEEDPLYVWSKVRSHDEAEATMSVADEIATSGSWYGPGWYWDPAWDFYAFAPAWGYLGGPFGWNYYSPGFLYGGFYGSRFYGRGFYGGGHQVASARPFHGGMGSMHAMGGMHSMGGGHR